MRCGRLRALVLAGVVIPVAASTCADPAPADPAPADPAPADTSAGGATAACSQEFDVIASVERATTGFTQGLAFLEGVLYESVGQYGESAVRQVDRVTFGLVREAALPAEQFGEGLTALNGVLYQLTWREQTGHIWNADLTRQGAFAYEGEGWGLTTDGTSLIRSDGTDRLVWTDPATMRDTREVRVADAQGPVTELNELEWVDGVVLANVWRTDLIVVVDPADGRVVAHLDLAGLRPDSTLADPNAVLNGIALDPTTGTLLVTGKRWPIMLELQLRTRCWQ